ncbi:MAG: T9SS type A sorting domain-containing protein [Chitinophagales bacterium]
MYQNLASEYKFFANIKDGSHCQFADANKTPCELGETLACLGTTYISRIDQQNKVLLLLKPWLDFWLKRDCNAISTFYNNAATNLSAIDTMQSKIINCGALSTLSGIKQNKVLKAEIFPNPSTGLFTLTIIENYTNATLTVYDISGKLVDSKLFRNNNTIALDYSYLSKGMYQLQFNTEKGNYFSKIVIE